MYFNKYFSFKTKEYIHKAIMSEYELKNFKQIVKLNMPEVDYNKLLIKRFNIDNEYKYINSPNSVGINALKEIEQSGEKYYTLELTDNELEELYEQIFVCMMQFKSEVNALENTMNDALNMLAIDKNDI